MINAKEEFLEHVENRKILCAVVSTGNEFAKNVKNHLLKKNFKESEFNQFVNQLNFKYDNGFGGQELFGTIWYEDGTWSVRGEYDGAE